MASEDEEWQEMQTQLRAIGERLIQAGWATRAVDTAEWAGFGLTPKGIEGMNQFFQSIKELEPHTMRRDHIMGLFTYFTIRDGEVNPPPES